MKKREKTERITLKEVRIETAGIQGRGVARFEGMVIFVEDAVPGDLVDIEVFRKKKNFMEAKTVFIHEASPHRVQPQCMHFGVCGGCKWQHMDYEMQLQVKQTTVKDNLERIAKVAFPLPETILAADPNYYYRNRLDFAFSSKRWLDSADMNQEGLNLNGLGFHIPGRFDKILDISHCHLQGGLSNDIRNAVKSYADRHELRYFDPRTQEGLLRSLIIRNADENELMVILVFTSDDSIIIKNLMEFLSDRFPEISSLIWFINSKRNDSIYDLDFQVYKGRDHIIEKMDGLRFKVGPKSFYQTNSAQAKELYRIATDFAGFTGTENVYDLYTGAGTIACYIASRVKHVTGIEAVPEAVEDAKNNAALNGIVNASFFAGDMKDILDESFMDRHGKPDVIITDPPRAGMHEMVCRQILNAAAEKIVYISCNPATQARDLALFDEKYQIERVRPVDMFPHTEHVENIVLLRKRSE
jgi:23S rRNA (uracil1939-C5)-methyltransferase